MNNSIHAVDVAPAVLSAQKNGEPIVALESTIISHGMPYPKNVETAVEVEQIVRDHGAIPATIAIIEGRIKIGLAADELNHIGRAEGVHKVSRRDIPYVISTRQDGATTVAGTMFCAQLAGIPIFATGGIGGVHRGAEKTLDISADIKELEQTNVAVVSAGVKAILDIPKTLEVLETAGVPVIGFQTDDFPAFYSRKSGQKVIHRLDVPGDIARLLKTKWDFGLKGGVVIANPVPQADELDPAVVDKVIEQALVKAERRQITGKDITPFLLGQIGQLTGGKSLRANIALVKNNARLAAQVAASYAQLA